MKALALITALAVAGCATAPPGTPGAGRGDTYTPVIDMQGLDMGRYGSDLEACRAYARQIDPARQEAAGMMAGIIVGALLGAAVGGNSFHAQQGAVIGGGAGLAGQGARARDKQETILANCMAGRGYRVLDGATQPPNTAAPSPYVHAANYSPQILPAGCTHNDVNTPTCKPILVQPAAPTAPGAPAAVPAAHPGFPPGCGWEGGTWRCRR